MAATDLALSIEGLSAADAAAGLALSDEAGWNQTLEDWRYFLEQGIVFGVRDADRRVIATAALLPSPPVTWVSMVLVTANWRRRGLANTLMKRCIGAARASNLEPWLDATPAGATVYRRMGFAETPISLVRLRRARPDASFARPSSTDAHLQKPLGADRRAVGVDRGELIRHYAARSGSAIYEADHAIGLVRAGRKARHVGPVYAQSETAAIALLESIIADAAGSLVIDLSAAHAAVRGFLLSRGFVVERPFARMRFGATTPKAIGGDTELVAAAGPEFG